MKVTMLGCGSSAGVPLIGCKCPVCSSTNPKNKRTRVSVFIEVNGKNLLIDSSPDLRQQALRHDLNRVDAVLYTHDHADHVHGIDDLRSFNFLSKDSLPIYGDQRTLGLLQQRFAYVFMPKLNNLWIRPSLIPNILPDEKVHQFSPAGVPVTMVQQRHGKAHTTLGYRIGNFAYSTDTDEIPEEAFAALAGTEIWMVDCLRYGESYSHSDLKKTLGWVERLKPRLAILTHMAHDFDYDTLIKELPAGVVPGYDGLQIDLSDTVS